MEGRIQVPTLKFDKSIQKWAPVTIKQEDTKINDISKLKFLTYNIWFDKHNMAERGVELRKIFQSSNADFICLQEVIHVTYEALLKESWVQTYYVSGNILSGYITLILSKYPCNFFVLPWPTHMSRYLLYAELELNGKPSVIGTVHLESLGNPKLRKDQLELTYNEFKKYDTAFLMGDFNFDSYTENKNITCEYTDVWKNLHPDDPGYTMKRCYNFLSWRPDRVIIKNNKFWRGVSIEKIGTEPIPLYKEKKWDTFEIITPSDHFGLKCIVDYNKDSTKGTEEEKGKNEQKQKGNILWVNDKNDIRREEIEKIQKEFQKALSKSGRDLKIYSNSADFLEHATFMLDKVEDLTLIFDYLSMFTLAHDWKMYIRNINERFSGNDANKLRVIVFDKEAKMEDYENFFKDLKIKNGTVVGTYEKLVNCLLT